MRRGTIFGTFPDKRIEEIIADAAKPEDAPTTSSPETGATPPPAGGELKWQAFTGRQHRRYAAMEPRITLGAKGMFYLNGAAFRALGEPMAVEMMLDKMRRVIGMKPTDPRKPNAFIVKPHGKTGKNKRISASAFCQHFGLKTSGTLLFNDIEFDGDGVLRLDLVNATRVGRGAK